MQVSDSQSPPATASAPLSITVNAHSVFLSWDASSSQDVIGYNAYRGTNSGGPYTKLNSSLIATTSYTDQTVQSGYTYYYVTTAVDSPGPGKRLLEPGCSYRSVTYYSRLTTKRTTELILRLPASSPEQCRSHFSAGGLSTGVYCYGFLP